MTSLERRYARLVRWFYPAGPRQAELVGTCLDFAEPSRHWPAWRDVTDLAAGGLRERIRGTGLEAGARLAGVLSLITLTALAAGWFVTELITPTTIWCPGFGPFLTPAGLVWTSWLLAAVTHVLSPGRWARHAIAVALLLTVAVLPFAALIGQIRPPVFVLLPQFALGVVALAATAPTPIGAVPGRRRITSGSLWVRLLPIAGVAAPALVARERAGEAFDPAFDYVMGARVLMPAVGEILLLVALLLAVGLAVRGDYRGGWTLLVLAGPIGMLLLHVIAPEVNGYATGSYNATYSSLAASALVIAVVAPALVLLAVASRRRKPAATATHCGSCGAPLRRSPEADTPR
ncbi:hypothetical protein [Actinoplanes sp. NPDC020271]|uniref:hypothetical protein n=1 Tax=Actinoplanes sp. NPDC020271 TaxID=3363896 RepID=UPI0037A6A8A6